MSENELTKCQEKLAQVQQAYEDFVYLVSHDLKAPIRAINNLAEWVTEDLGSGIPAEVKHNLDLLRDRSQRLDKMLAAILEISRVPRMNLQLEPIALSPFINDIKDKFAPAGVTFAIPENLPSITTYALKLQTVIEQIFDNAIKHNPDRAVHIIITCQTDDKFIKLSVTDNGAGIPQESLSKIFDIFYTGRGKEEKNRLGAGLTIIKRIVDFVGGNLYVEENSVAGTTFILEWPFKIIQKS